MLQDTCFVAGVFCDFAERASRIFCRMFRATDFWLWHRRVFSIILGSP